MGWGFQAVGDQTHARIHTHTPVYTHTHTRVYTPSYTRTLGIDEALVLLEEDAEDGAGGDGGVDVARAVQRVEHGHVPGDSGWLVISLVLVRWWLGGGGRGVG